MMFPLKSVQILLCLSAILIIQESQCSQEVIMVMSPFTPNDKCVTADDMVTMTANVTINSDRWGQLVELVPEDTKEEVETCNLNCQGDQTTAFYCSGKSGNTSFLHYSRKADATISRKVVYLRLTVYEGFSESVKSNKQTYPLVKESLKTHITINNNSVTDKMPDLAGQSFKMMYKVDNLVQPYTLSIWQGKLKLASTSTADNVSFTIHSNRTDEMISFKYDVQSLCQDTYDIDLSTSDSDSLSGGAIAGIIIGVGVVLTAVILVVLRKRGVICKPGNR